MIFASAAALLTQPILPRHPPHTCLPLRASRLDFYVSSARNFDAPGLPHAQGTEGWAAQAAGGLAALQANNILISQTSEVRPMTVPRSLLAMCSSHAPVIRKPRAVASHLAMFRATACISYLVAHLVSCLVTCSVSCLVSHPASHRSPCPAVSHSPCILHGLHPVLHPAAYLTPIPALFPALRFPGAYPTPYLASYPASYPALYPCLVSCLVSRAVSRLVSYLVSRLVFCLISSIVSLPRIPAMYPCLVSCLVSLLVSRLAPCLASLPRFPPLFILLRILL